MLDVSRGKVPTVETLELLIDRLSRLKINVVQLYLEHTFAHPGHADAWAEATPYTAGDIARLRTFAMQRHVDLCGHQASPAVRRTSIPNCTSRIFRIARYRPCRVSSC